MPDIVELRNVEGCLQDALIAGYSNTTSELTAFDLFCNLMRYSDGQKCSYFVLCHRDKTNPKQLVEAETPDGECLSRVTFGNEGRQQGSDTVE